MGVESQLLRTQKRRPQKLFEMFKMSARGVNLGLNMDFCWKTKSLKKLKTQALCHENSAIFKETLKADAG